MSFDIDRCIIKRVWCGNDNAIPKKDKKKYSRVGTRYECMKSGFGAGMYTEKRKGMSHKSLQQISYIGPKMEKRLIKRGIADTKQLLVKMRPLSSSTKNAVLKATLKNADGTINTKAYNSVIMYLYQNGVLNLPNCKDV